MLAEQTDYALEAERACLWEVVGTQDHDVIIEQALLIRVALNCPNPVADNTYA